MVNVFPVPALAAMLCTPERGICNGSNIPIPKSERNTTHATRPGEGVH